jgi:type IV secretory pathway protease TraF
MSARCATVLTTIAATGLLLSTLGGATPHYIWNASNSVPIGLSCSTSDTASHY